MGQKGVSKRRNNHILRSLFTSCSLNANFLVRVRVRCVHNGITRAFKSILRWKEKYPDMVWGRKKETFSKPGAFTSPNQHPIVCLNTMYKWFAASVRGPVNKHILSDFGLIKDQQIGAKAGCSKTIDNLDSEGAFRTGCRNVGRQHQFFSRLQSPRGSFSIKIVLLIAW